MTPPFGKGRPGGILMKNILISGIPGVGKTNLITKLSQVLEDFHPAGFYTAEIREGGKRVGFEMISFEGKRGLLSHIRTKSAYRVGKYGVDIRSFEDFLDTIPFFSSKRNLIIIDEIGKMECFSEKFRSLLIEILDADKWVIATIALRGSGLISEVKKREDMKLFEITQKNRDSLLSEILKKVKADQRSLDRESGNRHE